MLEELPTPSEIAECPELAILAVLDFTLEGCLRALLAAHPELDGSEQPYLVGYTAQYALRVLAQISRLKHNLERYRFHVRQDCAVDPSTAADSSW
jgi:hypothetical protein